MQSAHSETRFVICISNKDYPASLEVRKIYQVVPDANAAKHRMIRVIDESNEDYLYPSSYFVPIELPQAAESVFSLAN
ncbi:MAG: hypothetical protein QNJ63_30605 [Calothrix sp. MO_192.B10]|nr:hypothetical protein [Calothrix sp. MO_192.B10]